MSTGLSGSYRDESCWVRIKLPLWRGGGVEEKIMIGLLS